MSKVEKDNDREYHIDMEVVPQESCEYLDVMAKL